MRAAPQESLKAERRGVGCPPSPAPVRTPAPERPPAHRSAPAQPRLESWAPTGGAVMTPRVTVTHDIGDLLWERSRRARFEAALSWAGPAAVRPSASAGPPSPRSPWAGRRPTPTHDPGPATPAGPLTPRQTPGPPRPPGRCLLTGPRTRDARWAGRLHPGPRVRDPRGARPLWRPSPTTRRSIQVGLRSRLQAPVQEEGVPLEGGSEPRRCRPAKSCSPS